MKKVFLSLMVVSTLAMSPAMLAQDSMKHDEMKHDEMKHDAMHKDEMKRDEMADHKMDNFSYSFQLPQGAQLDGKRLAAGEYRIQWEGTGPDVEVSFARGKKVLAAAAAKIVELSEATPSDTAVVDRDGNGSDTLKEVRFAGKKYALVFGEKSAEADHHMKAGEAERTGSDR